MSGPGARGRGRHVADRQARESDWGAPLPPSAPGAVPVMQPPETMPTGIDLSELPRAAYAESRSTGVAGAAKVYPSRRSMREAEGRTTVADRPGGPDDGSSADNPFTGSLATPRGRTDAASQGSTASLMRSSALMAAGTLVSRILGMARAVVITWVIGLALSADAFSVANTLPNNLYILIAGGALNAVLVPQISRSMHRGEEGRVYVDRLLSMSVLLLGVAAVVVTAAAPLLVSLMADRFTPQQYTLAVGLAYWCLPQVFFYGLYTLLGQVLNARGSFGPYMWAPVLNNVVAILGLLCFVAVAGARPDNRPLDAWSPGLVALFAGTATLGVAAQALVLVPVLRRNGFRFRFRWGLRGVGLGTASQVAGWTFAAVLVAQGGYVVASRVVSGGGVDSALAGGEGAGSMVYGNAYLFFVLPHSLVAVSIVTAVFTRMSRAAGENRTDDVRSDLSLGLRTVGVATVLATAGFLVLARDLAYVMFFGNGREQTQIIGWVATVMSVALVAYSAQYLAQRVFYAFEDARTPFAVQVVATLVWVVGLVVVRASLDGRAIVVGAGAALAVSLVVGATLALVLVRGRLGGMDGGRVLRTHVRLAVGAVLAAVAGWSVRVAVYAWLGDGRQAALAALLAAATVMVGIYVAVLKVLQVRELDDLLSPLVGRFRR